MLRSCRIVVVLKQLLLPSTRLRHICLEAAGSRYVDGRVLIHREASSWFFNGPVTFVAPSRTPISGTLALFARRDLLSHGVPALQPVKKTSAEKNIYRP